VFLFDGWSVQRSTRRSTAGSETWTWWDDFAATKKENCSAGPCRGGSAALISRSRRKWLPFVLVRVAATPGPPRRDEHHDGVWLSAAGEARCRHPIDGPRIRSTGLEPVNRLLVRSAVVAVVASSSAPPRLLCVQRQQRAVKLESLFTAYGLNMLGNMRDFNEVA
jgi:hypothetical protein